MKHPDYTQNAAKIYDFGDCKATATVNERRKLVVLTPGYVNYPDASPSLAFPPLWNYCRFARDPTEMRTNQISRERYRL